MLLSTEAYKFMCFIAFIVACCCLHCSIAAEPTEQELSDADSSHSSAVMDILSSPSKRYGIEFVLGVSILRTIT